MVPVFKDLSMAWLLSWFGPDSLWYNCIYWSRFETPTGYKSSTISHLAPVVQTLDKAIHRINHYPADKYWETNCTIHWIDFYPVDSAIQRLNNRGLVIIRLACTKANSYSNFVTRPPSLWRSSVVVCIYNIWGVTPCGALKSTLRIPPGFWHFLCLAILFICLNLVWSSPWGAEEIRKAVPVLLSYPTVVGR